MGLMILFISAVFLVPSSWISQPPGSSVLNTKTAVSIVSGAAHSFAQESDEITSANWQQHPKIKTVRSLVDSINAELKKGGFKISVRKFQYCEPYEDVLRKLAVDSRGVGRFYQYEAGSDDSALTWQHYYDQSGRLRFAFIFGGAVNGSKLEHRIYFDENGKRLWEEHKYLEGPGYTFPEVWPEEKNDEARPIQKSSPAKAFAAESQCRQIRSRRRKSSQWRPPS
jgi:hypothetical protein